MILPESFPSEEDVLHNKTPTQHAKTLTIIYKYRQKNIHWPQAVDFGFN